MCAFSRPAGVDRGMERILRGWGGGEGAGWALRRWREGGGLEGGGLLTGVMGGLRRGGIHGFGEEWLERRPELAGRPLQQLLPNPMNRNTPKPLIHRRQQH